ncbi:hypothetical protein KRP22_007813 [Phytophthora ramorum]|uniref:N-acetyltransferase domain-containing protein n=1 Tax=Phytophthora ramorum TaxID=164328 RepID=H3GUP7_PHYRM|nr:N-acetyltransferase family 8 member 2 [Phytophthora ramorum]KAH7506212.1 N-acetyltransferase family 8 member 2 [Phytophthora ramorum]
MTAKTQETIDIRQYRPEDHAAITKILVEGLMVVDDNLDFRYLWEERVREDLTKDFADIEASHMAPGGNLWVATATKDGASKVVGMVGLQRTSQSVGEVRRVFVDPKCQRMGVGRKLLVHLERWSKEHGVESLSLTTSAKNKHPQAFYAAMGYTKMEETLYAWNKNPMYFELCKFVKQL